MRIKVDNPVFVPSLLAFLRAFPDAAAAPHGLAEIDVALFSALRFEARWDEVERRVTMWSKAHPEAGAMLLPPRR